MRISRMNHRGKCPHFRNEAIGTDQSASIVYGGVLIEVYNEGLGARVEQPI